jgi:hypothetical protein
MNPPNAVEIEVGKKERIELLTSESGLEGILVL